MAVTIVDLLVGVPSSSDIAKAYLQFVTDKAAAAVYLATYNWPWHGLSSISSTGGGRMAPGFYARLSEALTFRQDSRIQFYFI
jgi:hypothetical protein